MIFVYLWFCVGISQFMILYVLDDFSIGANMFTPLSLSMSSFCTKFLSQSKSFQILSHSLCQLFSGKMYKNNDRVKHPSSQSIHGQP